MKKAILILVIFAMLVTAGAAYSDDEIMMFAEGVMAADAPNAAIDINGSHLMIAAPAGDLALSDNEMALYAAQDLAIVADKIARKFPGRFDEAAGFLLREDQKVIAYAAVRYLSD